MSVTLPDAAARIGVPLGTPMSIPGWQASHGRRSQNGEVIGPLTGQMNWPEPGLIGPAGRLGNPLAALLSAPWILACSASRLLSLPSRNWRLLRVIDRACALPSRVFT